ncbi:MAG: hypothetical protein ACE5KO_07420, partial [Candidatus Bathyarchaeia archaeon]
MTEGKSFKATPYLLLPSLTVIAAATFLAGVLQLTYQVPPTRVTPFPEEGLGPIINAVYFVGIVAVAGTVIYFLVRKGRARTVNTFMILVYALVTFSLSGVYLPVVIFLVGIVDVVTSQLLILIGTAFVMGFSVFAVFVRKGAWQKGTMLFLGATLGALLGFSVQTISAIAILIALSLYDVFAVFVGPLGRLVSSEGRTELSGLMVSFGNLEMGLGDFVFYAMLMSHVYVFFGILPYAAALGGILLGAYITFKSLEKRRMLPGLPL